MKFLLLFGIICGLHIANSYGSSNIVLSTQKPKTESLDLKKTKRDALIDPYQQYYHQQGAFNYREQSAPIGQATKYSHPSIQHAVHPNTQSKITPIQELPPTALPLQAHNTPNIYQDQHHRNVPHFAGQSTSESAYPSEQAYNSPVNENKYVPNPGLSNYHVDQYPQFENPQASPQISSYNPSGSYPLAQLTSTPNQNYQYAFSQPQIHSSATQTQLNTPKNVIVNPTTAYTQGNPILSPKYPANFHTVQSHPSLIKIAGNQNESPLYHTAGLGHHQIQGFTTPLSPQHHHQNPQLQLNGYPGAITQHLGYGNQPNGKLIYQNGKFVFQQYPVPAIKMLAPNNNYRNVQIRYNAPPSSTRMPLYSKNVDRRPVPVSNGRDVHRPRPEHIDNTKERHENDRVSEDEENDRQNSREEEHDNVRYRNEEEEEDEEEERPRYKVEKGFRPSRYYEKRYEDSDEEDYHRGKQERYKYNDDDDEEEGRRSSKYISSEEDDDDDDQHKGAESSYGDKYDRKPYQSKYKGKYALGGGKKYKKPNYDYKYPLYSKGNGYEKYTTIKYATPLPKVEKIEGRYSNNVPVSAEHERKHYQANWFVTSVKS